MKVLFLVASFALFVSGINAVAVCTSSGRACATNAYCDNGVCKCDASKYVWGNPLVRCFKKSSVASIVQNDPVLSNFNNESVEFQYPCRYLNTHFRNELKNKDREVIGFCDVEIYSYNSKARGKFYNGGFNIALKIDYNDGTVVKLSSRYTGYSKNGVMKVKIEGTKGQYLQHGPWGDEDIEYNDNANGIKVEDNVDFYNQVITYEAKKCGFFIAFTPYDIVQRRAQPSIPGMIVDVNCAHHPVWLSTDTVMANAPHWQKGSMFEDDKRSGLDIEQSIFVKAWRNEYKQVLDGATTKERKGQEKCEAVQTAIGKCTPSEERKAIKNCYWMLEQPKFIYCMDKSKTGRNILQLFSKCVKVHCANLSCSKVTDDIYLHGCEGKGVPNNFDQRCKVNNGSN